MSIQIALSHSPKSITRHSLRETLTPVVQMFTGKPSPLNLPLSPGQIKKKKKKNCNDFPSAVLAFKYLGIIAGKALKKLMKDIFCWWLKLDGV